MAHQGLERDEVTHVVSEDSRASSLWKWLKECAPKNLPGVNVLDISWFTDSMREGRPVAVETKHLIQVRVRHITIQIERSAPSLSDRANDAVLAFIDPSPQIPLPTEGSPLTPVATVSRYACQRRTTLENHNKKFTAHDPWHRGRHGHALRRQDGRQT
ncbi:hypothetical protein NQZ68_012529 [Dissostichus eleginoides]|nr:hypothetical protein NQZ68_012529 [Dissostichus eleginoides]